jgi:hypothetical protein
MRLLSPSSAPTHSICYLCDTNPFTYTYRNRGCCAVDSDRRCEHRSPANTRSRPSPYPWQRLGPGAPASGTSFWLASKRSTAVFAHPGPGPGPERTGASSSDLSQFHDICIAASHPRCAVALPKTRAVLVDNLCHRGLAPNATNPSLVHRLDSGMPH